MGRPLSKQQGGAATALRGMDILSDLNAQELQALASICKRREFDSGETIMSEGSAGNEAYFLVEGSVDVAKELTLKVGKRDFAQAEKSMTTIQAGSGALFGDMSLLSDQPRSASVLARSPVVLYGISRDDFRALCDQQPLLGLKLLRRMSSLLCDRLRKGNADVLKLSTALSIALSK